MSSIPATPYLDIAVVTPHPTHKLPPTLGPGKITPAILVEWEEYCELFFAKDKTDATDHVTSVLSSFTHPSIKNWISMNKDTLRHEEYTFGNFVQELRKNFLDPQWINQILRNIVYARMNESETFELYSNRVLSGNNLLAGTDNHLPKAILRDTIENHLADYLSLKIDSLSSSDREHMVQTDNFDDWLLFMRRLDDSARAELQRFKMLTTRKRYNQDENNEPPPKRARPFPSHTNTNQYAASSRPPFQSVQTNTPQPSFATGSNAYSSSNSMYPSSKRLAKLTDDEREMLELHSGCKKCRRFYVQHNNGDCPNDFPDAKSYKRLTLDMAAETYKASQAPGYDAFHGIDCSTQTSRIAPVFAWGGPISHNPLYAPAPARNHDSLNQPLYAENRGYNPKRYNTDSFSKRSPPRAQNKSFYIARSKPQTESFRSFSYPSLSAQAKTHENDITAGPPPPACLPSTTITTTAIPSSLTAALNCEGGLTPETEESASDT